VYFGRTYVELPDLRAWFAVLVCAVIAGAAGGLFTRILLAAVQKLAPYRAQRPVATVFALGLLIAAVALWSHGETYGSGYAEAQALLQRDGNASITAYPLLKLLATILTYLTGVPGGIFSPTLSTGVGIGANLAGLFPGVPASAVMIIGMVSYFAGVTQAPMTGAIIVMEMVDGHELILPILGAAFIASVVSKVICPKPLYLALSQPFRVPVPQ
jgi:H+/Cl- antiporter ClcA